MHDFLVVSVNLGEFVSVEVDLEGPWRPHLGLKVSVAASVAEVRYTTLKNPAFIPSEDG